MSLIVIDIDDIKSLDDIEKFFILLNKAGVLFHPEMSFHDFIHTDENRNTIGPAFSEEESERLDQLMKKCKDLVDELEADIWKICKRANEKVLGKIPKKKKF